MRTFAELKDALVRAKTLTEIRATLAEASESIPLEYMAHLATAANQKALGIHHDLLEKRVADLERQFHDHFQAVPHAASEA